MATHLIKYFLLNKNELSYEVLIRGEEPANNVIDLKKQINKIVPSLPSGDILESGLDTAEDLAAASNSVDELASRVKALEEKFDSSPYERARALALHIYYRLKRINVIDPVLAKSFKTINAKFQENYNKLGVLKVSEPETQTTQPQPQNSTSIVVHCDHSFDNKIPKYDGETCVRSFLQKLHEYIIAKNISADKLLNNASQFFSGNALHWFRSAKHTCNTWEQLKTRLLEDFTLIDHDYRLLKEINRRTQAETENIVIYLSIMSQMFSRLIDPISEKDQLKILIHNIRPCYANVLASNPTAIESISALTSVCRNYERIQTLTSQFREPPRVSDNTIAPDLAFQADNNKTKFNKKNYNNNYNYNKHNNNYNRYNTNYKNYNNNKQFQSNNYNDYNKTSHRNTNTETKHVAPISTNSLDERNASSFCPRCRTNKHSLRECTQDRFPICFKCGRKNVKYPDCPTCHSSKN